MNRLMDLDLPMKLFVRNRQRVKHLKSYSKMQRCDMEISPENQESLTQELRDIDTLYYLIHSMDTTHKEQFEHIDLHLADIVSQSAYQAGVRQIIYLGGLGKNEEHLPLSPHLRNRQEVGDRLRQSGISVTEIRAGVIIGAGSASFEIIRALGSKLPFIPALNYNSGLCHPIDVDDVMQYLIRAYMTDLYDGKIIEIGMQRAYHYDEMIILFAKIVQKRQMRKVSIPLLHYLLPPVVVSRIISFLSAIPYTLVSPLIEGLASNAIKDKYAVESIDRSISPIDLPSAIMKASQEELTGRVESFWSIPITLQVLAKEKESFLHIEANKDYEEVTQEFRKKGLLFEIRERRVSAESVEAIFAEVQKIGGEYGYWSPQWLWQIRAFLDRLMGGSGLEVGRRSGVSGLRIGERLDFWIVSALLDKPFCKVLTLKGRLRSPGDSWLQFALIEEEEGWKFTIRAYFKPAGFLGYTYWYTLYFVHQYIFDVMIDRIIAEATKTRANRE